MFPYEIHTKDQLLPPLLRSFLDRFVAYHASKKTLFEEEDKLHLKDPRRYAPPTFQKPPVIQSIQIYDASITSQPELAHKVSEFIAYANLDPSYETIHIDLFPVVNYIPSIYADVIVTRTYIAKCFVKEQPYLVIIKLEPAPFRVMKKSGKYRISSLGSKKIRRKHHGRMKKSRRARHHH